MRSNEKTGALGRDMAKHISCSFEGHEADCLDNCEKCAIYIKTCGDELLAEGKVDLAIKQYKRALFVEPKFAEAWVNLGNAFGMKSEYSNALDAFDKAIAIDPVYGNAMFGKAITLRNLGRIDAATSLADAILLLYDNANVRKFKESLKAAGTLDSSSPITLDQAIEELTGMAYDILHKNDLLGPDGSVVTERAICQKEDFAAQVYRFCKKRYTSSGKEKFNSESILKAFYGSLCTTLFYYNDPDCLAGHNAYNYLIEHVDIERVDDVAEKMLNIRGDKTSCDNLWNLIYGYVKASLGVFEKITSDSDRERAVIDATESAYVMGMLVGMRFHEHEINQPASIVVEATSQKLGSESNPATTKNTPIKYCRKCGRELLDGGELCAYCRTKNTADISPSTDNESTEITYESADDAIERLIHSPEFKSAYNALSDVQRERFFLLPDRKLDAARVVFSLQQLVGQVGTIQQLIEIYITVLSRILVAHMPPERIAVTLDMRYSSILNSDQQYIVIAYTEAHINGMHQGFYISNKQDAETILQIAQACRQSASAPKNVAKASDYGFSADNPIRVQSIPAEYSYLDRLVYDNGKIVNIDRIATVGNKDGDMIDHFQITVSENGRRKQIALFLDGYSDMPSNIAPQGFHLK